MPGLARGARAAIAGTGLSALALVGSLFLPACGSSPGTPTPPSPSPTPGPVVGAYTLRLTPAASCGLGQLALSFPVNAASAPGPRYPGLQVLLVGDGSGVEAELLDAPPSVRGGVGTRGDGALATEAVHVWVNAVAEGTVTRAADGRGEVVSGRLLGYLALGDPFGEEGSLGTCTSADHSFSLRAR